MSEGKQNLPPVVWLKVTDYLHSWLQHELGSQLRIGGQKVICTFDIPGARDVLMMRTEDDLLEPKPVGNSISDKRKNMIDAGFVLDQEITEKTYGITKEGMGLFVPVECPRRCTTKYFVLRPWTLHTNFGRKQAKKMQELLREEFWKAVWDFNDRYAAKMDGKDYPAIKMIEAFCEETGTPDLHVDVLRREWHRRVKNGRTSGSLP